MKYYVKILIILLLCVLVPCITVLTVTNAIIFAQYRESVSASQFNRLQAIDNTNQLIFDNIDQGASRFCLDPSVQTLGDYTSLQFSFQENKYLFALRRAMAMLNEFVATNELFDSVYLYIDSGDYIISSRESVVSLNRFADICWMDKYEELKADQKADRLIPAHMVNFGYNTPGAVSHVYGHQCLTYVYPITPYISSFNGALVFNIYEDKLLQMYAEPESNSNIALFDENGIWITGVSNVDYTDVLSEIEWNRIFQDVDEGFQSFQDSYFFSNIGGSSYQCTYYYSQDRKHVLVSMDEMSLLMKKSTVSQMIFVVFLLLIVPFVALLILWGSRRLYSPIGNLVQELHASGRLEPAGKEKDDWSVILHAVNALLWEDRKLFSDNEREKLKEATFLRILAGDDTSEDEAVKTILPYQQNLCILAAIDANHSQRSKISNYDSRLRLVIRLIEDGLTGEGMYPTAMRYEDDSIVIILSTTEGITISEKELLSRLAMIQTKTLKVMEHSITFAVSSLLDVTESIAVSFTQVKNMMQYRFMKGLQSVLFYDRIYPANDYYNADERLKYIRHCLARGKKEELIQGVRELVGDIKKKENISYFYTSQILNQLVTILVQHTNDNGVSLEKLPDSNTGIYQRLWQNLTLEEARDWFCSMAAEVIDYENAGSDNKSEYIRKIMEYVHENYTQCITIDTIAEHIGISYSYLRKLYKEATGQNLSDYLNQLRIEKAKQLLRETNYPVKEIVSMCGYNHERSFFRSFTQMEGISPSKYKAFCKMPGNENQMVQQ